MFSSKVNLFHCTLYMTHILPFNSIFVCFTYVLSFTRPMSFTTKVVHLMSADVFLKSL